MKKSKKDLEQENAELRAQVAQLTQWVSQLIAASAPQAPSILGPFPPLQPEPVHPPLGPQIPPMQPAPPIPMPWTLDPPYRVTCEGTSLAGITTPVMLHNTSDYRGIQ